MNLVWTTRSTISATVLLCAEVCPGLPTQDGVAVVDRPFLVHVPYISCAIGRLRDKVPAGTLEGCVRLHLRCRLAGAARACCLTGGLSVPERVVDGAGIRRIYSYQTSFIKTRRSDIASAIAFRYSISSI